ncbi:hypothetical protein QBC38DRAFT_446928 [Podospora fimiseda]|uniref:FAS1 domain-containing protein n=1 Tax=Podospora fimiseda TaxID=252190 RepID=A0AAN7BIK5_9PEZI|nr:hypothetical protein QBC38DRAFT_446928 [Podospora fimiseda]
MKFSNSLFFATTALGAALPPVTETTPTTPSTNFIDEAISLIQVAVPALSTLPDSDHISNHLGFLTLDTPTAPSLPKRHDQPSSTPSNNLVSIPQTAHVIIDNLDFTQVWTVNIKPIIESNTINIINSEVNVPDATIIDTKKRDTETPELPETPELSWIPSPEDFLFLEHINTFIPSNTNINDIYIFNAPQGVTLPEYLGTPSSLDLESVQVPHVPTSVEKRHDESDDGKEIELIRIVDGRIVKIKVWIKVLGVELIKTWVVMRIDQGY